LDLTINNPLASLIIVTSVFILLIIFFWPGFGLLSRWKKFKKTNLRILMEDALKHVYECERNNLTCSIKSLAGALAINGDEVAKLLTRLEALKLIIIKEDGFKLAAEGKAYALRIIRVHRIWEQYLAEETSLPETAWHTEAEIREHQVTIEEANIISKQLGHPRYDPHGDPIPTPSGDLPPRRGMSLANLEEGGVAKVIHIEDEPESVFSQIIVQGITLGMQVEVVESSRERIVILADGLEMRISPIVANNVTVLPIIEEQKLKQPFETLVSLEQGDKAKVLNISRACRGQQRRRLMDLGIVPGSIITLEMKSVSGDPIAYNIKGATIALRRVQAEFINIKRLKEAS
jgi:DtxR family Mn-dependent transcriptional regulator